MKFQGSVIGTDIKNAKKNDNRNFIHRIFLSFMLKTCLYSCQILENMLGGKFILGGPASVENELF
jgi:hypothetical protein